MAKLNSKFYVCEMHLARYQTSLVLNRLVIVTNIDPIAEIRTNIGINSSNDVSVLKRTYLNFSITAYKIT